MNYVYITLAFILLYWILSNVFSGKGSAPSTGSHSLDKLVSACGGDQALAKRLMEVEKKKTPDLSDKEATLRALSKFLRDRGA